MWCMKSPAISSAVIASLLLFAARFRSISHLCACTTLQVMLPYLDSLVRLVYPAEDGKMTLSLISSPAGE